jgi:hypothetical protein
MTDDWANTYSQDRAGNIERPFKSRSMNHGRNQLFQVVVNSRRPITRTPEAQGGGREIRQAARVFLRTVLSHAVRNEGLRGNAYRQCTI